MRRFIRPLLILGLLGAAAAWFLSAPQPVIAQSEFAGLESGGDAARGRIIFHAGGCAACHATPEQDDRLKLGGGRALPSPFGTFYAPNISPDVKDGIGAWKAGDLVNAMQRGVSPQGAHYYPAFPFTTYQRAKTEDIRDLMVFLRTLAPVAGKARGHDLPFPFTIRRTLGLWKLLFFEGRGLEPAPGAPDWQRGRYLVEGLGHCGECHTPRNFLGGTDNSRRLAGGPNPEGKGMVPNITPDPSGLAAWSAKDIIEVLTTGFTPDYDSVGGAMAAVVRNTAELPEADRAAMAAYLRSLPPLASAAKAKKAE